jgi:hypothetical protein
MSRKKKFEFKLNPEWMLKDPLDFEYNKYTLLGYLQKCDKSFNKLEVYPDFIELSLHIANIQSLDKEKKLLKTNKIFESNDDEILLKDLFIKEIPDLSKSELNELDRTLKFSNSKLFDAFNLAKSIWTIAFDNIQVSLKKNKHNLPAGYGYSIYYDKDSNELYIWEYNYRIINSIQTQTKAYIKLLYQGTSDNINIYDIIATKTKSKKITKIKEAPLFEVKSSMPFPMDETFIPIMKRKIISTITQSISTTQKNWTLT